MTKYRAGFVSNSSSSSFVCEVCGEEVSGMDLCLSDTYMCVCKAGHIFCIEHLINREGVFNDKYNSLAEEFENDKNYEEFPYDTPVIHCPICQFVNASDGDIVDYFLIANDLTKKEFVTKIKDIHGTYETFTEWVKEGREKLKAREDLEKAEQS